MLQIAEFVPTQPAQRSRGLRVHRHLYVVVGQPGNPMATSGRSFQRNVVGSRNRFEGRKKGVVDLKSTGAAAVPPCEGKMKAAPGGLSGCNACTLPLAVIDVTGTTSYVVAVTARARPSPATTEEHRTRPMQDAMRCLKRPVGMALLRLRMINYKGCRTLGVRRAVYIHGILPRRRGAAMLY
jgi:hypothetical protein